MSKEIELLIEIRDLLQVMAEPALAKRDSNLRSSLRALVGSSAKRAKAVLLMDGSRTQATLAKEAGIDAGGMSRLVKGLGAAKLIGSDPKRPTLLVKVQSNFFETDGDDE
jgi:hypothetical protein